MLAATFMLIALSGPARAQEAGQRLYVVTHVDILGAAAAAEAAKMLQQFAADSRNAPGSVRFEVLREPNREPFHPGRDLAKPAGL